MARCEYELAKAGLTRRSVLKAMGTTALMTAVGGITGAPMACIGIGGLHPALIGDTVNVLSVDYVEYFEFGEDWRARDWDSTAQFMDAITAMGGNGETGMLGAASATIAQTVTAQNRIQGTYDETLGADVDDWFAQRLVQAAMMIHSEFGRKVHENGSAGTDHGQGGVTAFIGPRVAPGIFGEMPSLADGDLLYDALRPTVDFRSVLGMATNFLASDHGMADAVFDSPQPGLGILTDLRPSRPDAGGPPVLIRPPDPGPPEAAPSPPEGVDGPAPVPETIRHDDTAAGAAARRARLDAAIDDVRSASGGAGSADAPGSGAANDRAPAGGAGSDARPSGRLDRPREAVVRGAARASR